MTGTDATRAEDLFENHDRGRVRDDATTLALLGELHESIDRVSEFFMPPWAFDEAHCETMLAKMNAVASHLRADTVLPKHQVYLLLEIHPIVAGRTHLLSPDDQDTLHRHMSTATDLMLSICGAPFPPPERPRHPKQLGHVRAIDYLEASKNLGHDTPIGDLLMRCHDFATALERGGRFDPDTYERMCTSFREVAASVQEGETLPKPLAYGVVGLDPLVHNTVFSFTPNEAADVYDRMIDVTDLALALCQ